MKHRIIYQVHIDQLTSVLEGKAKFSNFPKGATIYDIDFNNSNEWVSLFCTSKDIRPVNNGENAPSLYAVVEKP